MCVCVCVSMCVCVCTLSFVASVGLVSTSSAPANMIRDVIQSIITGVTQFTIRGVIHMKIE
jgi:hypothetical protein